MLSAVRVRNCSPEILAAWAVLIFMGKAGELFLNSFELVQYESA